jgi:putative ABC transport system ATP-binding protein
VNQTTPNAIETRQVTKVFGEEATRVEALRGVDLDVKSGEFVAVMGASGSGKSTLLHLIAGLDHATGGTISVGGRELSSLSDDDLTLLRRQHMGLVFQAFNLMDVLTAEENVSLPLVIDGVDRATARRRALAALETVGLAKRSQHLPKQLSGGEQQRVALARALVNEPILLLADEPTGNLDSHNGDLVMNLLRRLADERKQTIFMVTHNPTHATQADRMIFLRDGLIVEDHAMSPDVPVHEILLRAGTHH